MAANDRQELQLLEAVDAAVKSGNERAELQALEALDSFYKANPRQPQAKIGQFRAGVEEGALNITKSLISDKIPPQFAGPGREVLSRFSPENLLGGLFRKITGTTPTEIINTRLSQLPPAPQLGQPGRFARTAGEITGASLPFAPLGLIGGLPGLATEAVAAGTSALGGATGEQIGGVPGKIIGTVAGGLTPAGLAGATRLAARGAQNVQPTLSAFEKAGTTPTVSQLSGNIRTARLEKGISRLPLGGKILRSLENQQAAVAGKVDELSQGLSTIRERSTVGEVAKQGIEEFAKRAQVRVNQAWKTVDDLVPRETLIGTAKTSSVLENLAGKIQGPGGEQLSKILEQPLLRDLRDVISSNPQLQYQTLKAVRSKIGAKLANPSLTSDIPRGELKLLYGALTDDMRSAVPAQAQSAWRKANALTQRQHATIDNVLEPLIKNKTDEKIFDAIMTATKDAPSRIRSLTANLTTEQANAVRAGMLTKLGQATPGSEGAASFSLNTFLTNWNKMNPGARNALYPANSSLRRDLDAVVTTAKRIRDTAKIGVNPSGTGQAILNPIGVGAIGTAGYFFGPLTAGAMLITPPAAASLMTSPKFVRWLATSTRIAPRSVPAHITRLQEAMQDSPSDLLDAVNEYLAALKTNARANPGQQRQDNQ